MIRKVWEGLTVVITYTSSHHLYQKPKGKEHLQFHHMKFIQLTKFIDNTGELYYQHHQVPKPQKTTKQLTTVTLGR